MTDAEVKKANALTAMMNDLGLGRMEELAKEDTRDGRRILFPAKSMRAPPPPPKPSGPRVLSNEAAQGWNSAVTSGAFRDEDALGVDGLDTIASGRLHAINKADREYRSDRGVRRHTSRHNHNGGMAVLSQRPSWNEIKGTTSSAEVSRYDPTNPHKPKPMLNPRRHPGLPARGICTADHHSAEVRGAVTRGPRKSSLPHAPTEPETNLINQPPPNTSAAIPPHMRVLTGTKAPEFPAKEANRSGRISPSSFARDAPANGQAYQNSESASVNTMMLLDANVHLPATSSTSEIISPRHDPSLASTIPLSSTLSARIDVPVLKIFFEAKITAARVNKVTGDVNVSPGKTYIFQYPGREVALWELRWSDGYVIREDIRVFTSPFNNGSRVIVRRQDRPNEKLRTTQVRVDDVALGLKFVSACKELKIRFQSSKDPRYPYTEEQNEPTEDISIDLSTLLPLTGTCRTGTSCTSEFADFTSASQAPTVPVEVKSSASLHQTASTPTKSVVSDSRDRPSQPIAPLNLQDGVLGDMIRHLDQQDALREEQKLRQEEETARSKLPTDLEIGTHKLGGKNKQTEVAVPAPQEGFEAWTPSRAKDMLIDTSVESSLIPVVISCVNDLDGMVYEQPPPMNDMDKATRTPSERSKCPKAALVPLTHSDLDEQQTTQVDAYKQRGFSTAKLAKVPVGVDLSRQSLSILSHLGINHYRELSHNFEDTLYWVKQTESQGTDSFQESVAVQVVLVHLARYTSFKELNYEDQLKTTAVVFCNLLQLKTGSVIKYSLDRIIQLRGSARPAPPAVILANDYLKLAMQAAGQRQSGHGAAIETQQVMDDENTQLEIEKTPQSFQPATRSSTESLHNQPPHPLDARAELPGEDRGVGDKTCLEEPRWV